MNDLTSPQRRAINDALSLLRRAKVDPETFNDLHHQALENHVQEDLDIDATPERSYALQKASYIPPIARCFNELERSLELHRVTKKSFVTALVDHPEGAVVEYPQAGARHGEAIAHRFLVDPKDFAHSEGDEESKDVAHPKQNIQYSLGDKHGGRDNVTCYLLRNSVTGEHVVCCKRTYQCCSTKFCSFSKHTERRTVHVSNTAKCQTPWSAHKEVFMNTLALFTALQEKGCAFESEELPCDDDSSDESDNNDTANSKETTCRGRLILFKHESGQLMIQCQYCRKGHRNHLRLTDLNPYNISYLSALFSNAQDRIKHIEEEASRDGYGPLVPCEVVVPASARRQYCTEWHRAPSGNLERGELRRSQKCNVMFDIYTPNVISDAKNQILIVCRNTHTHPKPAPTQTPPVYKKVLKELLLQLSWKLADATPRRALLDTGFMTSLRSQMGWSHNRNPVLADLHPSFSNDDHVKRLILKLRNTHFPSGTGLEGVKALIEKQMALGDPYVRFAAEISINGETFTIVICMTPTMSAYLLRATRLTIDTSFKRVVCMEEFEIETWLDDEKQSVVICRAFITSQSATAHFELFRRIFDIAQSDTGLPVHFRHIHGDGYKIFVADEHKGQSLGLGMYMQSLCTEMTTPCIDEPEKRLCDLDPYEHLMRQLRLCTVHFGRNAHKLKKYVSREVFAAILSLATTETIEDLEKKFALIRSGGKKAVDWLDDKLVYSKFAFPALYWKASKIPLEIWKAAPATTNGNEQSHRNINRDGIGLTLLAGVMRGMHYDRRAFDGLSAVAETGVLVHDEVSTHHNRKLRTITRKVKSLRRRTNLADSQLQKLNDKIYRIKSSITKVTAEQHKDLHKGKHAGTTNNKLKKLRDDLNNARTAVEKLKNEGSGKVMVDVEDNGYEMVIDPPAPAIPTASTSVPSSSQIRPTTMHSLPIQHPPPMRDPDNIAPRSQTIQFKSFVPNPVKWYG